MTVLTCLSPVDGAVVATREALSQIPEVAGLATRGHSVRTGHLARDIGRELGLHPDIVEDLEYAGYMHDIGITQLSKIVGIWLVFGWFLVVRLTSCFIIVSTSGFQPIFNVTILILFQHCFNIKFSAKFKRCKTDIVSMLFQHQVFKQISMLQS